MKIAVICAIDDEIKLLRDVMDDSSTSSVFGVHVTAGTISGHDVVVCVSGIGKTNAAATAQFVVCEYNPDVIINIGLAGNCEPGLPLGGAVVAQKLLYHDFNMKFAAEGPPYLTEYTPDPVLSELALRTCGDNGIEHTIGIVATGDVFVNDSAIKSDIVDRTGCSCVEMESAAIAQISHKCGVRYAVIKIMSDNADENAHDDFAQLLPLGAYCDVSVAIVSGIIKAL